MKMHWRTAVVGYDVARWDTKHTNMP